MFFSPRGSVSLKHQATKTRASPHEGPGFHVSRSPPRFTFLGAGFPPFPCLEPPNVAVSTDTSCKLQDLKGKSSHPCSTRSLSSALFSILAFRGCQSFVRQPGAKFKRHVHGSERGSIICRSALTWMFIVARVVFKLLTLGWTWWGPTNFEAVSC